MFLGRHITSFQGKNRLVLVKKFRDELNNEDRFYIIMGNNGEIWGYRVKDWLVEAQLRRSLPIEDSDGRKARRFFFSRTEECLLDSQGRFIIPQEFVDYAELGDEILMVGAGDYFEIWDQSRFKNMMGSEDRIPDKPE